MPYGRAMAAYSVVRSGEWPSRTAVSWRAMGDGRGMGVWGQTGSMQNSQPSGAKGFAILVGVMVGIVLVIMAIAVILSPHH